ncbi:hypothetical protein B7463_g1348, partial [Scytalidium lignicola]
MGVLYNEYRLTVPGLVLGVTGVTSFGVSRAILSDTLNIFSLSTTDLGRQNMLHSFVVTTFILGTIISGMLSYSIEHIPLTRHLFSAQSFLLCVNAFLFTGSVFSGSSLIQFSPISFKENSDLPWMPTVPATEIITSTASTLFAIILSLIMSPAVFIPFTQIASFIVSVTALLVYAQADELAVSTVLLQWWKDRWLQEEEEEEQGIFLEERNRKQKTKTIMTLVLTPLIITSTWLFSTTAKTILNPIPPSIPARLDNTYVPSTRFDIVVSMYQEDLIAVKHMLKTIKSASPFHNLDQQPPRVIIYTKSPTANTTILKSLLEVDAVYKLDNLGREGGTYLHHIVHNWGELARQTMFLQATAHNLREVVPRINNFLVPNTGMLSLGFAGVTCDCNSCTDRWGWEDQFGIVPSLYSRVYNETCTNQQILLSYKGQFVASARRIRGVSKDVYEDLLEALTSEEGWSHNKDIIGDGVDRLDAPYFGYTVERIWSLLMQCSDTKVAALCPSLLSEWRSDGRLDDCQCLDPGFE